MSIDALIAACYAKVCAPPPVGTGGSVAGGRGGGGGGGAPRAATSTAAMRNPLGAARNAAGASGVEHLIKQSAGHPAQRYIQKAHEAFRDAHRQGIGQDNSSAVDHAAGMKALRQAHAVAKATSPRGPLHVSIKTALDKKNALSGAPHTTKTPAGAIRAGGSAKAARAEARTAQSSAKTKTRSAGHMKLDKASRAIAAEKGFALPNGKFPIRNARELGSAAKLLHRTNMDKATVKQHIIAQAHRLGLPVPASLQSSAAFTREEFLAAAEEFYNHNHGAGGKFASSGGGGGGFTESGVPRLSQSRIRGIASNKAARATAKQARMASAPTTKKSGNYTTKVIPGHTQNPKKSGNYTTKPLPTSTAVASLKHRLSAKRIQQGARRADYLNKKVGTPAEARKPTGIAATIAKHNERYKKTDINYIGKANAARMVKAESRANAKTAEAATRSKPRYSADDPSIAAGIERLQRSGRMTHAIKVPAGSTSKASARSFKSGMGK